MVFLIILLGFLPGFAWVYFYLQEDPHSEPKGLIVKTFLFGMIGALFAVFVEQGYNQFVDSKSTDILIVICSLLGLAAIEEVTKFLSAKFAVRKSPAFYQPIDAMIYSLIAALGFATLENIGALVSPLLQTPPVALTTAAVFETITFRFVGATLLHALTGAIIGYYWAIAIREFGRWSMLIFGIVLATLLHAFFNYLILNYEGYLQPILLLTLAGFFVLSNFERFKNKSI